MRLGAMPSRINGKADVPDGGSCSSCTAESLLVQRVMIVAGENESRQEMRLIVLPSMQQLSQSFGSCCKKWGSSR